MNDRLQVEPALLHQSARQIDTHAADMRVVHAQSHATASEAMGGFVGESAAQLGALLEHWERFTDGMHATLNSHAEGFHVSARTFHATDADGTVAIRNAGGRSTVTDV